MLGKEVQVVQILINESGMIFIIILLGEEKEINLLVKLRLYDSYRAYLGFVIYY